LPLLAFFADVMGLIGGAAISQFLLHVSPSQYLDRVHGAVDTSDLFVGLVKAPVFAFIIAIIGCMHGLRVTGSAESVGRETTRAVVKSIFLVIVLDALLLHLLREAWPVKTQPLVSARGIVNRFGEQVIHDEVDLDILPGEVLGIAGGSGSGKSVLLRTLTGLHRPTAGEVLVDGRPIGSIHDAEKASLIGVLFQQGALFSSLSVAQNIMLPIRLHTDVSDEEQEKIAAMKLELAGLSPESGLKFPAELSGGMVKRAAFARALALDPRILFLDEPTSDLDPLLRRHRRAHSQLNEGLGVTFVIVTHDLNTLFNVCDRVAMLVDGKIVVDTMDRLMHSQHPWIKELLHGPRAQGAMRASKAAGKKERTHGS
jgi:phospholipid/cholesterol/gamma-HCH transport system ATP-binding protein